LRVIVSSVLRLSCVIAAIATGLSRDSVGVLLRCDEYLACEATACLAAVPYAVPLGPWRLWARLILTGDPAELAVGASELAQLLAANEVAFSLFYLEPVQRPFDAVGERAAHPLCGVAWRQLGQPGVRCIALLPLACTASLRAHGALRRVKRV
jgi:hypothetical protein